MLKEVLMEKARKKYPNTAGHVLMTVGLFLMVILTLLSGILSTVAISGRFYENYRSVILANAYENITCTKARNVLDDYINVKYYNVSEYNCSSDYKGKTNFRYIIINHNSGETFGNYKEQYEYEVSYEATHNFYNISFTVRGYKLAEKSSTSLLESYNLAELVINVTYTMRYIAPVLMVLFFICVVILFCKLMRAAGHHGGSVEVTLSWFDKVPFDLVLAIFGILPISLFILLHDIGFLHYIYKILYNLLGDLICDSVLLWTAGILFFVIFYVISHTFAVRVKRRRFWENTIIYMVLCLIWKAAKIIFAKIWYVCKIIWRGAKKVFRGLYSLLMMIPLVWRTVLVTLAVILYSAIAFLCIDTHMGGLFLFWWVSLMICVLCFLIYSAWATKILENSMREMAGGNITYKTDMSKLHFFFQNQARYLNSLGEGLEAAVQAQMKSERFKTELITNVSHDIKTPLTSIINYSDLLISEKPEGKIGEYAEVIFRQSERLKKLTEDLLEASKASSGNITVEFEQIELNQMLRQVVGEYEERLSAARLVPMVRYTDDDMFITADGKLLWRVFDNLLSNIVKYSLNGTRVYISLTQSGENAVIAFKNISRDTLNVDTDELLERFVQGDSSRHSEGSGLGLSIASSLCELMHGKLTLSCDGDLFRVDVTFPILKNI